MQVKDQVSDGLGDGYLSQSDLAETDDSAKLLPKILLVEDNPINQSVTTAILNKLGYRVTVASDGAEALKLFHAESWQVILMDCQMPVMDGYESTRRIRLAEAGRGVHLPVIAVTAHVSEADRQKCLESGMDDYLPKPFGLEDLAAMLKRWLA